MAYIKKSKPSIEQQIRTLFTDHKDLQNLFHFINPTLAIDIRKKCQKLLKNSQIASIARKIKSKLATLHSNDLDLYISSKSFEYSQFVRMVGYVQLKDRWAKWTKDLCPIIKTRNEFYRNGIVETELEVEWNYYARHHNFYFKNLRKMMWYLFTKLNYIVIIVNEPFIKMLTNQFRIQKTSARSFAANIERYEEFQKIEAGTFMLARINKVEIASQIFKKVCEYVNEVNYFTKRFPEFVNFNTVETSET